MSDRPGHPVGTIAVLLDLTERRVQQLAGEGVIPRNGHGRYEIGLAVRGYVRYLRERAVRGDPAGADEVGASRALLLKARARLATLEADQFEGQLLRRADVEKVWAQIISNIRTRLIAIPQATAQAIVYLQTPGQVAGLLTTAVIEALDDISSTPVYVEANPSADAQFGAGSPGVAASSQAAADPDSVPVGGSAPDAEFSVVSGPGAVEHGKPAVSARDDGRDGRPGDSAGHSDDVVTGRQNGDDDQPVRLPHGPGPSADAGDPTDTGHGKGVVEGPTDTDASRQPGVQRQGRGRAHPRQRKHDIP
jgi:phage terminase Nu1 subunit (DNA packaging protein)